MTARAVKVDINGVSSLMTNAPTTADPLAPETKLLKPLTAMKNKTDEIHEKIARYDWEFGLYFDDKIGPFVPAMNIRACLIRGARLSGGGKSVERAVTVPFAAKILYKGPRTREAMYVAVNKHGRRCFVDRRSVKVGRSLVMRTRCIFREWKLKGVEIHYDDTVVQEENLIRWLRAAGTYEGLLDARILGYGRFSVNVIQ